MNPFFNFEKVTGLFGKSKSEKQSESYFLKRGERVIGPHTWEQVGNFVNSEKAQKGDLIATSANGPYTLLMDEWKSRGTSQKRDKQQTSTASVGGKKGKPGPSQEANGKWFTCPKCGSRMKAKNKSRHVNRCDANQQTQSGTEFENVEWVETDDWD